MVTIVMMNDEIKDAIRQFTVLEKDMDWTQCVAVTLTMKQQSVGGEILDEINASRNVSHFLARLNKKTFGNSYLRHGCQVNVMPVQEYTGRIHYHLLIEIPTDRDKDNFKSKLIECWGKTTFGYGEICIEEFDSEVSLFRWGDYITKFKDGNSDQLDWGNYHWN